MDNNNNNNKQQQQQINNPINLSKQQSINSPTPTTTNENDSKQQHYHNHNRTSPQSPSSSSSSSQPPQLQHHNSYPSRQRSYLNKSNNNNNNNSNSNNKKHGNHLLNFKYDRKQRDIYENDLISVTTSRSATYNSASCVYSKEQFLQANCQFMVSEDGDYEVHSADPDTLVNWDKVEEIQIRSRQEYVCPICLHPPVSAKITRCGHVYCWPCILHYLALSDQKWRKCPICYESIYKKDLKSALTIKLNEYKVGDEIELNLMFKEKSCTIAMPITVLNSYVNSDRRFVVNDFSNKSEFEICKKYMKLQIASIEYVRDCIIKREKEELNHQMCVEGDQPEAVFISEALKLLTERENAHLIRKPTSGGGGSTSTSCLSCSAGSDDESVKSVTTKEKNESSLTYVDAFEDLHVRPTGRQLSTTSSSISEDDPKGQKQNNNDDDNESTKQAPPSLVTTKLTQNTIKTKHGDQEFTYLYQSADGQRIYINSLNIRCLVHEYGSIENCPSKINGKIVFIDSLFMNEELRRRYKHLSHLPLHSEFQVIELDLCEPLVSKKTLSVFEREIKSKKQMRQKKERLEQKRAAKLSATNTDEYFYTNQSEFFRRCESMPVTTEPTILDYNQDFPHIDDDLNGSAASGTALATSPDNSSTISSTPPTTTTQQQSQKQQQQQPFSFAQMLRYENSKKKNEELWPKLSPNDAQKQQQQQQTFAAVWPKKESTTNNNKNKGSGQQQQDSDDNDENDVVAPEYQNSFYSAIDSALQKLNDPDLSVNTKQKGKNNKKKKTKNILFST